MSGGPSRVEVRRGSGGLELRVDGTLASVVGAGHGETGPVWAALAAPLLALPPPRRRRALILGLGAGAAARLLRALEPGLEITGVELDADVLAAARTHFGLDALGIETVHADAVEYVRHERRGFDLVIEDLFVGPNRAIHKPPALWDDGYRAAWQRVAAGGVLAVNTIHEGPRVRRALAAVAPVPLQVGVRRYYNRIYVAGHALPGVAELRRRLAAQPLLRRHLPQLALRTLAP
ncbi:MAG: class I SAM-dependent methyltransferase [Vicinamibacteria bacterium]|nr:class I SAM-dependent methyltransferase [Vicinamibacteria bacterium]